jgi:RNA polymerase sigma factor (sigma-70 family)
MATKPEIMTAPSDNPVADNQTPDDFTQIVTQHHEPLYRFAFSLTQTEADAKDLTQQTFYIWATKGHQLRDLSKAKAWLFTTLYREFLSIRRKAARFPHFQLDEMDEESPAFSPDVVNALDAAEIVALLGQVEERYQAPLSLFYLEDYSYKEIAEILDVPLGTVQSRISRGIAQLKRLILSEGGVRQHRPLPRPRTAQRRLDSARREANWDWMGETPGAATC